MKSLKIITIWLIVILIVLTLITVWLLVKNRNIIKESFFASNHNCPPYTSDHTGPNSFSTKLKSWCTTADYGSAQLDGVMDGNSQSNIKCPPNYYRVSGNESLGYDSKSWCVNESN